MQHRGVCSLVGAALLLCGACSLHSLDYLGAGSSQGGGGQTSGGKTGGEGGFAASDRGDSGSAASLAGGSGGSAGSSPELPDCADGAKTVDETDIDCGGRTCAPCADEQECITGTDCASAICTNQVCQPPMCSDLAVNGDETDLNCGGATCAKCTEGQHCSGNSDCATDNCGEGICVWPACSDEILQDGCPLLVDNTPYTLAPEHAPTKCVDNSARSVTAGNAMHLYTCNAEPHQAFWTVAREDGYFAFRNALSGKCLQVRGASMAEGAVVEQGDCTYAAEQLWKPERLDDHYMRLTAKISGSALDVAGDNVTSNSQGIVQGTQTESPDTHWQLQKRTAGAYVALSPNADKSLHISHDDALTAVTGADDDESASWRVLPGLNDASGVSFESRGDPGRYLRHANGQIWSDKNDGTTQFKRDATFRYVNAFVGTSSQTRGVESMDYPGRFLLRDGTTVRVAQFVDSSDFRSAATWWLTPR